MTLIAVSFFSNFVVNCVFLDQGLNFTNFAFLQAKSKFNLSNSKLSSNRLRGNKPNIKTELSNKKLKLVLLRKLFFLHLFSLPFSTL